MREPAIRIKKGGSFPPLIQRQIDRSVLAKPHAFRFQQNTLFFPAGCRPPLAADDTMTGIIP